MHAILCLEDFAPRIYEPACGRGAIVRVLEQSGYNVALSDLVDYETVTGEGERQGVVDFLETKQADGEYDIVTNPPYGEVLNGFVAHALRVHRPGKLALLLNLNFLAGFDDPDRNFVMDECPPARIYVFKRRLPMMHRDGWDGPEASSRMNTAWFVWERREDGSYGDQTIISRVDWKEFGAEANAPDPQDSTVADGQRGIQSSPAGGAKADVGSVGGQVGGEPGRYITEGEREDASAAQVRNEPESASGATVDNFESLAIGPCEAVSERTAQSERPPEALSQDSAADCEVGVTGGESAATTSIPQPSSSQAADQTGAAPPPAAPVAPSKADMIRKIRPHCQHPDDLEQCAGVGRKHCRMCQAAIDARESEVV